MTDTPDEPNADAVAATPPVATPRPKRVPRDTLEAAERLAQTLFESGGQSPIKVEVLAANLGHPNVATKSSSSFDNKLALLRAYHLATVSGAEGTVQLSDIGRDVIRQDDPELQRDARRRAFLSSAPFATLLKRFDGMSPTADTVAVTAKFEFTLLDEAVARKVASNFLESVRYAGFVDHAGVIRDSESAETASSVGDGVAADTVEDADEPEAGPDDPDDSGVGSGPEHPAAVEALSERSIQKPMAATSAGNRVDGARRTATPEVVDQQPRVDLRLSLHGYSADEVVAILSTLGYGGAQAQP